MADESQHHKDVDLEILVEQALEDEKTLEGLLHGISPQSRNTETRNRSFQALTLLSERHPEALLPHWSFLADLLQTGSAFCQYPAVHILANLVRADGEGRFERIFDAFYGLLRDGSVSVATHVAGLSGQIARARPALQPRITRALLSLDETPPGAAHKDLVKGYAIDAFDQYFEEAQEREAILAFVRGQLGSSSPRTRRRAESFLGTHSADG